MGGRLHDLYGQAIARLHEGGSLYGMARQSDGESGATPPQCYSRRISAKHGWPSTRHPVSTPLHNIPSIEPHTALTCT
jgi:hypothetical protein